MRHAYLIIAHGNFRILEKQLRFLDSENADFYIHIDDKVPDFDFEYYRGIPNKSKVVFVDRLNIHWGDFSQVLCELSLFSAAVVGNYDYYHLLSGVDVPVKSRDYIEHFFDAAPDINYVNFENAVISDHHLDRVRYRYPMQEKDIKNRYLRSGIRAFTAAVQRAWGVDRIKSYPDLEFQKGTNWCSLTHEAVSYIVEHQALAKEIFRDSCCGDEMLVQTILINSPCRDKLPDGCFQNDHSSCLRYIDWKRGKPYTFTDADFDELIRTPPNVLFARKFDYNTAPGVVDRLFEYFSTQN